jgi:hypothetical protein
MKAEMKGRMGERGCKEGTTRRAMSCGAVALAFACAPPSISGGRCRGCCSRGCGDGALGEQALDAAVAFAPIRRAGRACDAPCGALQLRVMTHAACCPGACRLVVLA